MRATAQDPDTAGLMGVDINRTIAITFLIGGALAGAAGVVQILYNNMTVYNMGFRFGLISFTAAVLGGIGNMQGAVLGALVLGEVNSFSDRYFSRELDPGDRLRRPDRHPRLQADRPPRPAAGGSRMSTPTKPSAPASAPGSATSVTLAAACRTVRESLRQEPEPDHRLTIIIVLGLIYPVLHQQFLAELQPQRVPAAAAG